MRFKNNRRHRGPIERVNLYIGQIREENGRFGGGVWIGRVRLEALGMITEVPRLSSDAVASRGCLAELPIT